jgi:hypothetical protein
MTTQNVTEWRGQELLDARAPIVRHLPGVGSPVLLQHEVRGRRRVHDDGPHVDALRSKLAKHQRPELVVVDPADPGGVVAKAPQADGDIGLAARSSQRQPLGVPKRPGPRRLRSAIVSPRVTSPLIRRRAPPGSRLRHE